MLGMRVLTIMLSHARSQSLASARRHLAHLNYREPKWTESIAVGSESFIALINSQLNRKVLRREIEQTTGDVFVIREAQGPY